jgi:hypothetical protein
VSSVCLVGLLGLAGATRDDNSIAHRNVHCKGPAICSGKSSKLPSRMHAQAVNRVPADADRADVEQRGPPLSSGVSYPHGAIRCLMITGVQPSPSPSAGRRRRSLPASTQRDISQQRARDMHERHEVRLQHAVVTTTRRAAAHMGMLALDGQRTTRNPYGSSAICSRCKHDRLPRYDALGGAVGSACSAPAHRTPGEGTRETPTGSRLRRRGLSAALAALSIMHSARCSCRRAAECSRQQGPPAGWSCEASAKT